MTAISHERRGREDAPAPPPAGKIDWTMVGALVAAGTMAISAVWTMASADRRIASLEQQIPPGMLQRLDERTLQMQTTLDRLAGNTNSR